MEPLRIIQKYYKNGSLSYRILVNHSLKVKAKALEVAARYKQLHPETRLDMQFIGEAAMLHDIGIFLTYAPRIGCHGEEPYVKHGILGAELLRKEGLPRHAIVCERHVGVGLTKKEIREQEIPLPEKDFSPVSLEEKIISFADKFFSKLDKKEHTIEEIRKEYSHYGPDEVKRFDEWLRLFDYL